jgi:hypothetical protein
MMTGAEGEGRLDLDSNIIRSQTRAIMRAVNNQAASAHRFEAGKAFGNPINGRNRFDAERFRRLCAGRELDQLTQCHLVRRGAKMDCYMPTSVVALKRCTRAVVGTETFAEVGR